MEFMADKKVIKKVKTLKKADFDIREIYTPLSVAKKEIWKRWHDPILRKKVEDFLSGDILMVFKKSIKLKYFSLP